MKLKTLNVDSSWDDYLVPILTSEDGMDLISKLESTNYHPRKENIFKAFSLPRESVKLIIVGQDVYPDKELATGIAFGVPKGKDSASLKVIRKELCREYHEDITSELFLSTQDAVDYNFDNTMEYWKQQGVLMLNSALTCTGKPGDQWDMWQPVMTKIMVMLNKVCDVPFIFLGKKASTLKMLVKNSYTFPHPAADAYGKPVFVGSGIFGEIDKLTKRKIKWLELNTSYLMEVMTQDLPF